ncbi:MAG TPA: NAD(P)H-dependent oxidoreductase [Pseudidiomarina sp.]|nr:NAD(P)H-dependent oxidoreductase [Pseudidiomarina sp.]
MSILILAGSSRKESLNKKLQQRIAERAKALDVACHVYPAEELDAPIYHGDYEVEHGVPAGIQKLVTAIRDCSKVVIVTPEYNGSVPPLLKNAIDWTSRVDQQPWKGKTVLLAGASPGRIGAMRAMDHLRAIMMNLQAWVAPMFASCPNANDETIQKMDDDFLKNFVQQGD